MFKQLFATMNEVLDEIIAEYDQAPDHVKEDLEQELAMLKDMSDSCIEEWLLFEEKLGQFAAKRSKPKTKQQTLEALPAAVPEPVENAAITSKIQASPAAARGQGYYKLAMYREAVRELEQALKLDPEDDLTRTYLAMAYLRTGQIQDAYRQFQLLAPLTEDLRIKCISYQVMGCIQAQNQNLEQAARYFRKALLTAPAGSAVAVPVELWSFRHMDEGLC